MPKQAWPQQVLLAPLQDLLTIDGQPHSHCPASDLQPACFSLQYQQLLNMQAEQAQHEASLAAAVQGQVSGDAAAPAAGTSDQSTAWAGLLLPGELLTCWPQAGLVKQEAQESVHASRSSSAQQQHLGPPAGQRARAGWAQEAADEGDMPAVAAVVEEGTAERAALACAPPGRRRTRSMSQQEAAAAAAMAAATVASGSPGDVLRQALQEEEGKVGERGSDDVDEDEEEGGRRKRQRQRQKESPPASPSRQASWPEGRGTAIVCWFPLGLAYDEPIAQALAASAPTSLPIPPPATLPHLQRPAAAQPGLWRTRPQGRQQAGGPHLQVPGCDPAPPVWTLRGGARAGGAGGWGTRVGAPHCRGNSLRTSPACSCEVKAAFCSVRALQAHIWVKSLGRQLYLGGYEQVGGLGGGLRGVLPHRGPSRPVGCGQQAQAWPGPAGGAHQSACARVVQEEHAAEAYDIAALKSKGRAARINFGLDK